MKANYYILVTLFGLACLPLRAEIDAWQNLKQKIAATTKTQRICAAAGTLLGAVAIGSSIWFLVRRQRANKHHGLDKYIENTKLNYFYHATGQESKFEHLVNVPKLIIIPPASSNRQCHVYYCELSWARTPLPANDFSDASLTQQQVKYINELNGKGVPLVIFLYNSPGKIDLVWNYSNVIGSKTFDDKTEESIFLAARKAAGWKELPEAPISGPEISEEINE